jgi:hypothetical protein
MTMPFDVTKFRSELLNRGIVPYAIKQYSMNVAATDQEVILDDVYNYLIPACTSGELGGVSIKYNNVSNDAVPLQYVTYQTPFASFYITWTAKAGQVLYLALGKSNLAMPYYGNSSTQGAEAALHRWGRVISPAWVHAAEQVAPGAATALVTKAVTAGKSGYIYGLFIATQEANDFLLNWTSGGVVYHKRITFGASGALEVEDPLPMNEGLPADAATNVTITNVNAAGGGMIYQANLLYGEI